MIAGLKCPPDVEAQVMIAKAIPMAKAQPIGKIPPKAATPMGDSRFRVKVVIAAMPGKLIKHKINFLPTQIMGGLPYT